ncbi:MAG: hypothetical protein LBI19_07245 [Oscillospiraceae bacterium]|nr:hypothetical protein [Oscillospiraceae bacterium]
MGREQQGFEIMPGEDFQFACPTNAHNIEIAYTLYRRHFAHLPFDGVFLDKIRHASFAGGLENGLGCFCESCRDVYARQGVDADEIVQLIRNNPAAFLPADMRKCIYRFENEAVDRFYQAKANIITSAVAALTDRFLEHRLPVALDVFAPLLAYLVGQDLLALSVRAAFIKPMIYCITHAPAGLPFELKWLRDCFAPHDILARMGGDIDTLCSKESVKAQLRELKPDTLRPGFEINIVPDICESSPGYVASFAALLAESGFANAVLSWNLLGASGDNLKALSGCFYSTPT